MSNLNFNAAAIKPHEGMPDDIGDQPRDTGRRWSSFQTSIFAFVESGHGNAIVEAVAGSGKSTTIIEALKLVRGSSLFLAFNKPIADELKSKGVNARTFHSLCFSAVLRARNLNDAEPNKLRRIIRQFTTLDGEYVFDERIENGQRIVGKTIECFTPQSAKLYGGFAMRLVGLARQQGMGFLTENTYANWKAICDHHDIEPESEDASLRVGIEWAMQLLEWSNADQAVDFDDMLYIAVRDRLSLPKFDFVFVDEAQDTNLIQREILRMVLRPGGRLVAVGDPAQAIYGFRGADSNSMNAIREEFNCTELPLSITYRCPQTVVSYVQQWVSHIQAAEGAPEGAVNEIGLNWDPTMFQPNDLVVCRTTAPLIRAAFTCIRANVPVQVMGRDIGQNLKALIKQMDAWDLDSLEDKLRVYRTREMQKAFAEEDENKAQAIDDKVSSLLFVITNLKEGHRSIEGLERGIDYLFAGRENCVKLATIHKSKGLEADNVWWLDYDQCPAKWARQPWQKQEEINLCYVAGTRAKRTLSLISGPGM